MMNTRTIARGFGHTDVGRVRQGNEDAYLVDDPLGLYVVSDGMGGHVAGERAARAAVEAVHACVRRAMADGDEGHDHLRRTAYEAAQTACRHVYELAAANPELAGMGCTLTLLVVANGEGAMAHIGDTRLYLCRDGEASLLSLDHTITAQMVRRGEITEQDAADHPYAHVLTRALGQQEFVEPDLLSLDVLPGDVFLLCSDGLPHYLPDARELARVASREDRMAAARELVHIANERGGRDNITAVLVDIGSGEDEAGVADGPDDPADEVRSTLRALRCVPMFRAVPYADLLRLYGVSRVRAYRKRTPVFSAGNNSERPLPATSRRLRAPRLVRSGAFCADG